ncbi:MAG: ABC transporter permease, partial [Clostridia bacterium]|nr:ABC transporter permease [Clostridia bacterium]
TGKDDYNSTRLANDPANNGERGWDYSKRGGAAGAYNYTVRLSAYNYFIYKFGYEPSFAFGTDSSGYDIFSRLASGARFSFLLAIIVSVINLTIGALYGAIEGYYGGVVDIAMERFSDILRGVPFTVVTVLFQLHLAAKVGVVGSLIFAFVLTGWIGMASRVRMQFYRFKNQEYVLAARTLGASDWRIIWKHIFPNSLGTIITGSILVIPGVIFSETSLSYLGIINLDSATMSSVGTMLSLGQKVMTSSPHVVLFPALFIALLEISFNLFGNGLRDAFNPSLRGSEE